MAELLVAEHLEKIYGEGDIATRALKDVSFTLQQGEFASIVGQSGSGKSTLLNLLGLLDTPSSGNVRYEGRDTASLGRQSLAALRNELIGFVFQFHYLLPEFSVWENLTMPAAIAGRAIDTAEKDRALKTLALLGLEGLEDKNANALSGGQKQRVAIGRALMNRPKLILADEPTGNLDTANTEAVYKLFREISAEYGTTFLVVTHDRRIAQQTDRILEVLDGELVQDVRNEYVAAKE
ncbi:MAG: ABC transporter ATP-binding protein [Coriobacteriia bacterium]|nr:ABC transporter ATP-binding protein [Coriobacteriia bacterium]MBN2823428.1 ABC transporter ATP-binding protein [Coriobacteriia bacterium]